MIIKDNEILFKMEILVMKNKNSKRKENAPTCNAVIVTTVHLLSQNLREFLP